MNGWNKRWKNKSLDCGWITFKMYQLFSCSYTVWHFSIFFDIKWNSSCTSARFIVIDLCAQVRPTSDGFQSWRATDRESLGCTVPTNVSQFLEGCVPIDVGFPFLQNINCFNVTVRRSAQSQFFEWRCKDHRFIFAILEMSRCVQKDKFWVDSDEGADSTSKWSKCL